MNDAELIFQWRNDPWIVQKGSLNKTVTWEEHKDWFSNFIQNPYKKMFIIMVDHHPAGQVRFVSEENTNKAEISIYLLKDFIGKGLGTQALQQACQEIKQYLNIKFIIAYILKDNKHSCLAFEKAGFKKSEDFQKTEIVKRDNHYIYILYL